jgi:cytochrome c oxidase subunit 1
MAFVNVFFFFFLCGGLTGMWLSHVGLNVYVHDTFYVVAHFHFMFSASTFSAVFALIYYYFSVLFGIKYSKIFSILHLIFWFGGQWLTFLPLFWVGYNGLPRRYHDYPIFYMGWHGLSTIGHFLTLCSILFFFLMILDSMLEKKIYTHNTLGIPRFNKRINYYFFKIRYNQYMYRIIHANLSYNQNRLLPKDVNFELYK